VWRWSCKRRPTGALLGVAALVWCAGCATVGVDGDREDAFARSVAAMQSAEPATGMAAAWQWLEGATADDPNYDRALLLLGRNAEALGLRYAASLWYLEVARARRDAELVPPALAGLDRIITTSPHDEETLVRGFLSATELSGLPASQAPFLEYHQGLDDARKKLFDWAEKHFRKIPAGSPYHARAEYVRAVRAVARDDLGEAQERLERLLEQRDLPTDVTLDARQSLARLHYHAGRFNQALSYYKDQRELARYDPELLLEMAWTLYHLGDSRRALGLLVSLDAPIYQDLIAPQRFLLEALCLRRLCQFGPARNAAVRLEARYGDALEDLRGGTAPVDSKALRAAGRHRGLLKAATAHHDRLAEEQEIVRDADSRLGEELHAFLGELYSSGLANAERRVREVGSVELLELAAELLEAEEGVRLILHELSVGILRGRSRPDGPPEPPPESVEASRARAVFPFDGEFWTDELDSLAVVLDDRCID
jgi:hypothetical protein